MITEPDTTSSSGSSAPSANFAATPPRCGDLRCGTGEACWECMTDGGSDYDHTRCSAFDPSAMGAIYCSNLWYPDGGSGGGGASEEGSGGAGPGGAGGAGDGG